VGDYNPTDPGGPGGGSPAGDPNAPSGTGLKLDFSRLLKMLGYNSSTGGLDIASILPFLLSIGGGAMTNDAARKAAHEMSDRINQANTMIGGYIGQSDARYAPYVTGGQNAFAKAQGMGATPLAPLFRPLGSGAALNSIYNAGRR
jgi:hypothetical protein